MTDIRQAIKQRIEGYEDEMVRFQSEMVAIPALGPVNEGEGELKKATLIETWCRAISPDEVLWINAPDDRIPDGIRPNLLTIFKGQGRSKCWILSHIDVVPPGEPSLWESDPYVLKRDGDRIYGRGVEDNQHGIISSYFAMKALREEGITPAHDVGLIFVSDEETGSDYGLGYLLETRPDLFSPDDLIIVPDAGRSDGTLIEIAEKSMLWIKVTVRGRQCHASTPDEGANSLRAAARIITRLDEVLPSTFDARDDLYTLPYSTFEPTKKESNVPNVNTIPGEDVFYFDARVLPQYDLNDVIAEARTAAKDTAEKFGVTVEVESTYRVQAPRPTSIEAPVVKALSRAIESVTGRTPEARGIGGGTVAAFFREKGLPAVVWSTIAGNAHTPNEYTLLSYLKQDAEILAQIFMG